jgi:hypothetical protein
VTEFLEQNFPEIVCRNRGNTGIEEKSGDAELRSLKELTLANDSFPNKCPKSWPTDEPHD